MFVPNCNWLPYYLMEQYECKDYKPKDTVDELSNELDELHEKNMEYLETVSETYDELTKSLEKINKNYDSCLDSLKEINKNYDSCLDSLKEIKEGMKYLTQDLKEESKTLEIERYGHEL